MTNTHTSSGNGCSHLDRATSDLVHGSIAYSAFWRSGDGESHRAHRETAELAEQPAAHRMTEQIASMHPS